MLAALFEIRALLTGIRYTGQIVLTTENILSIQEMADKYKIGTSFVDRLLNMHIRITVTAAIGQSSVL